MLAEQVLHERAESTENAVTLTRVLDRHDALTDNVAWTQVEFTAGLVAEGAIVSYEHAASDDPFADSAWNGLGLECLASRVYGESAIHLAAWGAGQRNG